MQKSRKFGQSRKKSWVNECAKQKKSSIKCLRRPSIKKIGKNCSNDSKFCQQVSTLLKTNFETWFWKIRENFSVRCWFLVEKIFANWLKSFKVPHRGHYGLHKIFSKISVHVWNRDGAMCPFNIFFPIHFCKLFVINFWKKKMQSSNNPFILYRILHFIFSNILEKRWHL